MTTHAPGRASDVSDYLTEYFDGTATILFPRGSTALYVLFKTLHDTKGPGDVLIPTLCCESVAMAASFAGLNPVFVDVDPHTLCMTPESTRKRLSDKTRAIVLVYLYGKLFDPAPFKALQDAHDVIIIEDIAHAVGGRWEGKSVGSTFDFTMLSFFDDKIISGKGGALVCRKQGLESALEHVRQTLPQSPPQTTLDLQTLSLRNLCHSLYDICRADPSVSVAPAFLHMLPYYWSLIVRNGTVLYPDVVLEEIKKLEETRALRYERYLYYRAHIRNKHIEVLDLPEGTMCWRPTLVLNSMQMTLEATRLLRENRIPASNHHFPLDKLMQGTEEPVSASVGLRLLNLWVDDSVTGPMMKKTVDLLNAFEA